VDDHRLGAVVRALRLRKGWRQSDVAARARVSPAVVGRLERGGAGSIPLGKIRAIVGALGGRFDPLVRWQGADLGRLLDSRHAAMHESMARMLAGFDGWLIEPEVSFSVYGERGIIDVLAWHPRRRVLLVIELKTEIVDVSGLLGSMDQRRRLAWDIARSRGWDPVDVSTWVVVAEGRTNRRAVAAHAGVLRAKMPDDGRTMRRWLRDPSHHVDALSFLPIRHQVTIGRTSSASRRVSRAPARRRRA
jgi:transcriptional regulator with XRE-family HTH domain